MYNDIIITKVKVRKIDNRSFDCCIPVNDVIKMIAPQECRVEIINYIREGREESFYIVTYQEFGGLCSTSKVIKADSKKNVHISFNTSIDHVFQGDVIEEVITEKAGIPVRRLIDQLRYEYLISGGFMEDPIKVHNDCVERIKARIYGI